MTTQNSPTPVAGDPPLDLKTPWLAALMTWAIPGLGQIYQGRYFKGILFLVCILGMFCFGVKMGEGRPVYSSYYIVSEGQLLKKRNYGYLSQMLVGVAAMPALLQARRFESDENTILLDQAIDAPFIGTLDQDHGREEGLRVIGTISLASEPGPLGSELTGRLQGELTVTGEPIDLELSQPHPNSGRLPLATKISANPQRQIRMRVQNVVDGPADLPANLNGSIPRPWTDWFQVPLQDDELQDLNARLGKQWELAMVLTWIAGLLNILAIWDAYEGPAYGTRPQYKRDEKKAE